MLRVVVWGILHGFGKTERRPVASILRSRGRASDKKKKKKPAHETKTKNRAGYSLAAAIEIEEKLELDARVDDLFHHRAVVGVDRVGRCLRRAAVLLGIVDAHVV